MDNIPYSSWELGMSTLTFLCMDQTNIF